jgi:hypothetical protein
VSDGTPQITARTPRTSTIGRQVAEGIAQSTLLSVTGAVTTAALERTTAAGTITRTAIGVALAIAPALRDIATLSEEAAKGAAHHLIGVPGGEAISSCDDGVGAAATGTGMRTMTDGATKRRAGAWVATPQSNPQEHCS